MRCRQMFLRESDHRPEEGIDSPKRARVGDEAWSLRLGFLRGGRRGEFEEEDVDARHFDSSSIWMRIKRLGVESA